MDTSNSAANRAFTARNFLIGAHAFADALIGAAIVGFIMIFWLVPPALLLPAFSLFAVTCAAAAAAFAWRTGATRESRNVTAWDFSGAFVLGGIAAGMLSEPENVVQLFGLDTTVQ
jgi:hypothetical protein